MHASCTVVGIGRDFIKPFVVRLRLTQISCLPTEHYYMNEVLFSDIQKLLAYNKEFADIIRVSCSLSIPVNV